MKEKKIQLVVIVTLLLVFGFTITSLSSYFVSRSSLRQEIDSSALPLTSDNIYSEIQRDLLRLIAISSLMANDTFLRDWVLQGEQDTSRIIKYLKEIQVKYKAFTSFFVSERSRIYYHADGILKTVRPEADRDKWYFRVRDMQQEFEINVDPDMAHKDDLTIFINYKVFDYHGNYIGATGVGLTVSSVKQLIDDYQQRYRRNIYFVNPQGRITLHGSAFPMAAETIYAIEGMEPLADLILSGGNGRLTCQRGGATVRLNTRYLQEFQWYLIVEQREEGAFERIKEALGINLILCGLLTLMIVCLTNYTISVYQRRLETMALTDKLTGAYNRQSFDLLLKQTLKDTGRSDMDVSVILFDIDHFKRINDTHGHLAGDAVLQHVVAITKSNIRETDILCRWGGEEFVILLKGCGLEDAFQVAENVRKIIWKTAFRFREQDVPVSISAGVVRYEADETVENLLNRVDRALYEAKQGGRNRSIKARWECAGGKSHENTGNRMSGKTRAIP